MRVKDAEIVLTGELRTRTGKVVGETREATETRAQAKAVQAAATPHWRRVLAKGATRRLVLWSAR
jgi:transcriptional regulator of nitric oxide reductase